MPGDELRLRHIGDRGKVWSGVGHVVKLPDNYGDEVGIEFKSAGGAPTDSYSNYVVEYVWKATSFDRFLMRMAALSVIDTSNPLNFLCLECKLL